MLAALLLVAMPAKTAERMIVKARSYLGTPYKLGGRSRTGVDCQGLVFLAAESVTKCSWRSYAVSNLKTVAGEELGPPVPGFSPVKSTSLDPSQLQAGDYVMLVGPTPNPAEAAIGSLDGKDVWVWHVGLFTGNGRWIVGDHIAGRVIEVGLLSYLQVNAAQYSGVFVTRPKVAPRPAKCRTP